MHTRSKSRSSTGSAATPSKTKTSGPTKAIEKKKRTSTSRSKSTSATKPKVNDILPGGKLTDLDGNTFNLEDLYAEKGLIVFCVPKANTQGCTKQAMQFKESYEEFNAEGFEVMCVSADSPKSQKSWKDKYELPFKFGSDKDRAVLKSWGCSAKGGSSTTRSHFIAEKGGKLLAVSIGTTPKISRDEVMEVVRGLKKEKQSGGEKNKKGGNEKDAGDTAMAEQDKADAKKDEVKGDETEGAGMSGADKKEEEDKKQDEKKGEEDMDADENVAGKPEGKPKEGGDKMETEKPSAQTEV